MNNAVLQYNANAFDAMKRLIGIKTDAMFIKFLSSIGVSIARQNFRGWKKRGTFPLRHLITICNSVHFPAALFFMLSTDSQEPHYKIISDKEWKDIRLEGNVVGYRRIQTDTITVDRIINKCNEDGRYLGDVIIDENMRIPMPPDVKPHNMDLMALMYKNTCQHMTIIENDYTQMQINFYCIKAENDTLQKTLDKAVIERDRAMMERDEAVKRLGIAEASLQRAKGRINKLEKQINILTKALSFKRRKHAIYMSRKRKMARRD